jgi:hypothetical protein
LQKLEIGRADNHRRQLAELYDQVLGLVVANFVLSWSRNSEAEIVFEVVI